MDREDGQGLVEYALVLLLVGTALAGMLSTFGSQMSLYYQNIANAIP